MTKLFQCTLTNKYGRVKERFFLRGKTAVEVASKIQICHYCDGSWTIESVSEELLLEEGLDFWAQYAQTA